MTTTYTHPLLDDVENAMAELGMTPTTFGQKALNDPSFVFHMRQGREPRRRTVERVLGFIHQQKNKQATP